MFPCALEAEFIKTADHHGAALVVQTRFFNVVILQRGFGLARSVSMSLPLLFLSAAFVLNGWHENGVRDIKSEKCFEISQRDHISPPKQCDPCRCDADCGLSANSVFVSNDGIVTSSANTGFPCNR